VAARSGKSFWESTKKYQVQEEAKPPTGKKRQRVYAETFGEYYFLK